MLITGDDRMSRLTTSLATAPNFLLDNWAAENLATDQIKRLHAAWPEVSKEAALTKIDRAVLTGRAFLNPFIFEGASPRLSRARLAT
jgi:serine/threonine-protein kinase HipA